MTTTLRSLRDASQDDRGSALIIALLATVLLTALGVGLILLTNTEGAIASNFASGNETMYAADAAIERVMQDILLVPRWNDILTGTEQSAFIDDSTTPTLPNGQHLDLTSFTAEIQADSDAEDFWGDNDPVWHLFAYGPLADMAGTGSAQARTYVAVWIADDPSETDGDPTADANGVLTVLAKAWGPNGSVRTVECTVAKTDATEIERGLIAQRGQEELNQRARKAAVQLPGKALTAMDMNVSTGGMTIR
jgi:hypothetical protein